MQFALSDVMSKVCTVRCGVPIVTYKVSILQYLLSDVQRVLHVLSNAQYVPCVVSSVQCAQYVISDVQCAHYVVPDVQCGARKVRMYFLICSVNRVYCPKRSVNCPMCSVNVYFMSDMQCKVSDA